MGGIHGARPRGWGGLFVRFRAGTGAQAEGQVGGAKTHGGGEQGNEAEEAPPGAEGETRAEEGEAGEGAKDAVKGADVGFHICRGGK